MRVHLVNRFNAYKSGNRLIGVAGELTLPEITNLTDTMEGAGTGGNMDIPVVGLIEDMEMEVAFMSLCEDVFSVMDPTESADLSFNGALQGSDPGTGAVKYQQLSIAIRGTVKKFTPGTLKAGAKMDSRVTLGLSYYKITMDGKVMMEIDRFNGVYTVNGKDIMAEVRNMC